MCGLIITVAGDRTFLPVGLGFRKLFSSSPLLVQPWLGWLGHESRITCDSVEAVAEIRPTIVMEATGHYQSPVVQFPDDHQYLNIVINPLISHNAKKTNLRRLKTDAADAHLLGTLFYKEEFEPYKKRGQRVW
ncbi:IS110 family transposase [Paenibacillus sp. HWE-109]|nr:IS110 family transposase [Paenibacillus sp. HWE-109]UKS28023.1 IS110 family transposase [Paenibacillus sp. HWE-109]